MDRRGFLKIFGKAAAGAAIVYSFPSIIIPKNISAQNGLLFRISDDPEFGFGFSGFVQEIYPKLIEDEFFKESSFLSIMKAKQIIDNKFSIPIHNNIDKDFHISTKVNMDYDPFWSGGHS